jgi:hypothetical protein
LWFVFLWCSVLCVHNLKSPSIGTPSLLRKILSISKYLYPFKRVYTSIRRNLFTKDDGNFILFLFPLNPGISWKWTENSLFWLEYLSVLCLKVSIYQFCRKQLTKVANLIMHSQCAGSLNVIGDKFRFVRSKLKSR